jgi:maltose alpha-D-glucosyltransferase/alpha-amylase
VGGLSWLITLVDVQGTPYFLPLALGWEEDEEHIRALAAGTLARVRQQANVGVLAEAILDAGFCRHVVKSIGAGRTLPTARGSLRFSATSVFHEIAGEDVAALTVGQVQAQSTNTSVTLGDKLFLKCFRRVRPGINPELEVGRFLTEKVKFRNCVPVAGAVEYQANEGGEGGAPAQLSTLMLLQQYVPNQGDGWSHTLAYLERFLESRRSISETLDDPKVAADVHGAYLALMQTLATRTAELHKAFATPSGDPAFEPEALLADDVSQWKERVRAEATDTLTLLEMRSGELAHDAADKVRSLLAQRQRIFALVDSIGAPSRPALKIRHHGDYHLGQVLIANNDFLIIDFEGEPSRPLAESRRKHSPLRDVAGMLRSFNYAKWSAIMRVAEMDPAYEKHSSDLDTWELDTRNTFLAAYADAMRSSGLFASFDDVRGLLRLFELEKVLYELRYELSNRPTWVHIPLQGLLGLLDAGEKAR